ncbi:MAG: helix-turn-helix domain containing protein [Clostridiales bacterium]|nr:helix-turn-helix domain containing protein [Clostridiales bacterium]MCF8022692.1 helix-turn-helix domain containing protein [Clostridiales bacterium]
MSGRYKKNATGGKLETTEYIVDKIKEFQGQGKSDREIACEFNVSRQAIANFRKKHNIPAVNLKNNNEEKFYEYYKQKYSDKAIAKMTGVSYQAVQKWRKKHGLKPNRKKGGRTVGKIRDDRPLYKEAKRVLNNKDISCIIRDAAYEFLVKKGINTHTEITAWASLIIPPAEVFHPAPGGYCIPPENTNLTHTSYAAHMESRQDKAGLCGVPSVELLEKAIELSNTKDAGKKLADLVGSCGYIEEHRTVGEVRQRVPDQQKKWEKIWDEYKEKSISWAPVQRESKSKAGGIQEKIRVSGKKGKGGGTKNIQAAKAFQGVAGY